jgi:hypothetical protein
MKWIGVVAALFLQLNVPYIYMPQVSIGAATVVKNGKTKPYLKSQQTMFAMFRRLRHEQKHPKESASYLSWP